MESCNLGVGGVDGGYLFLQMYENKANSRKLHPSKGNFIEKQY